MKKHPLDKGMTESDVTKAEFCIMKKMWYIMAAAQIVRKDK